MRREVIHSAKAISDDDLRAMIAEDQVAFVAALQRGLSQTPLVRLWQPSPEGARTGALRRVELSGSQVAEWLATGSLSLAGPTAQGLGLLVVCCTATETWFLPLPQDAVRSWCARS